MHRSLITHLAVLAVGLAAGIGSVAVASSGSGVGAAASNKPVVAELKKANHKLDILNKTVGGSTSTSGSPAVKTLLNTITRSLGGHDGTPASPTLDSLLTQICTDTHDQDTGTSTCPAH